MLLEIDNLVTQFATKRGLLQAVDGVSLSVDRGEALGVVGESGSGKSAIAQSIMRLIAPPGRIAEGSIRFDGEDLLAKTPKEMQHIRGARISMIFQDPTSTLNPVMPVGAQILELLSHHTNMSKAAMRARVIEMLDQVGIPEAGSRYSAYPHELSGGMQQRIIIACALILHPELVIADEPTTALDVTVQAQILDLLRRLQQSERGAAVILITHDLGVVAQMCDRICVVYAGNVVESGTTRQILEAPRHPYTIGLIASIPRLGTERDTLEPIPGAVADPVDPPSGCKFHPRCRHAVARCRSERPVLRRLADGALVACHRSEEIR